MSDLLRPGQVLRTASEKDCQVERFLAAGGQGEVYLAKWCDRPYALKWYKPETATAEQARVLETLAAKGPPSERFLWPLEMVPAQPGSSSYGYLMPLREHRFKNIPALFKRRMEPGFRALGTAGLQLAEGFRELHAKGLCYCDVSPYNVFFDADTGDVAICDNDNVIVNGEKPAVVGTPEFMAPEVVRLEALPSRATDQFSLAVLLFELFFLDHPLKGKKDEAIRCLDLPARTKLFGTEPLYIFDPKDDSNRPVPGLHDAPIAFEKVYPACYKRLFEKAFTVGLHNPNGRVTETEWMEAMASLRDSIVYCTHCRLENFYDADALQGPRGKLPPCWSCRKDVALPFRLKLGHDVVMLNHDTRLFPHHLEGRRFDFSALAAEVVRRPRDPSVWGLKNLCPSKWVLTSPNGSVTDIEPGRSAMLESGCKINFGKVEGEVRY
jgi:eukaryotic-like serine/threonine-protein kinase